MVFKALFHGALAVVRFPERQLPRLRSSPLAFNLYILMGSPLDMAISVVLHEVVRDEMVTCKSSGHTLCHREGRVPGKKA